jgi:hypothetical protein
MFQEFFMQHSYAQVAMHAVVAYLLCGSIVSYLIGVDLVSRDATSSNIGRWRYDATAWAIAAAIFPIIAAPVYLRHRGEILEPYPDKSFAYKPQILPVVVASLIPLALAIIVMAFIPVDRCNAPERLRGLEKSLSSNAKHPIETVVAKSAEIKEMDFFTGEHYCRAVVDIKWVGEPLVENQGIWYRVVRFGTGWGSQTAPEFQKREQKYQYDKLTGRE